MTFVARPGSYLYQRAGSRNWHLRLQYPSAAMRQAAHALFGFMPPRKIERSLGTPDRAEAELLAGPEILQHRRVVLAFQAMSDPDRFQARFELERVHRPGTTLRHDDGSMTIATTDQVIHVAPDGRQTITPNTVSKVFKVDVKAVSPMQRRALRELEERVAGPAIKAKSLAKPDTDVDKEIVENWISERNPARTHANAARNMLKLFQELHPTKTFATADRDDGRAMVKHLEAGGAGRKNVSVTIKSKLSGLVAAVNLEMARKNPRVSFNPFAGVAKKKAEDTTKRLSLSEADVKKMEANRHLFTKDELLMWTFCLHTGARPAEIYALQEEFRETLEHHPVTGEKSDIRFIWIDRSKNAASTRRVPIPAAVLPLLPSEIKGPLFSETLDNICGRINDKMRDVGITSPDPVTTRERKPFYSTRHRCKSRLAIADCPEEVRKAIMGHTKDEHSGYGDDMALWKIKPWIEWLNHEVKMPPTVTEALRIA